MSVVNFLNVTNMHKRMVCLFWGGSCSLDMHGYSIDNEYKTLALDDMILMKL